MRQHKLRLCTLLVLLLAALGAFGAAAETTVGMSGAGSFKSQMKKAATAASSSSDSHMARSGPQLRWPTGGNFAAAASASASETNSAKGVRPSGRTSRSPDRRDGGGRRRVHRGEAGVEQHAAAARDPAVPVLEREQLRHAEGHARLAGLQVDADQQVAHLPPAPGHPRGIPWT